MKYLNCFLFFLLYPLFINSTLASSEFTKKYYQNVIKNSQLIVEAKVNSVSTEKDKYKANNDLVNVEIIEVIKGNIEQKNLSIKYPIDVFINGIWENPNFKEGETFIAILFYDQDNYWIPVGGRFGKFLVNNGKIGKSEIEKEKFKKDIKDLVQGKIETIELPYDSNLESEESDLSKLNGEFFITAQGQYPSAQVVEFKLNPSGALDKDGNQLSFSAVRSALQRAFDTWNSVNHSYPTFSISTTQYNGSRNSEDAISTITFELLWYTGRAYYIPGETFYIYDLVFSSGYTDLTPTNATIS